MEHYKECLDEMDCLKRLVEELAKTEPREDLVRLDMEALGLTYTQDPVERINVLIKALHPTEQ